MVIKVQFYDNAYSLRREKFTFASDGLLDCWVGWGRGERGGCDVVQKGRQ